MRPVAFVRQELAGNILNRIAPVLEVAAAHWRTLLKGTRVIAVTGSLGKTTAKECLFSILSRRESSFMSVGNQNAGVLLPLNVLRIRPWHRYAVVEAAAGRPDALRRASRILRPDLAVIVALAEAHRSTFKSLEAVAAEKLSLLNSVPGHGKVVVNGDEPLLAEAGGFDPDRVLRFGTGNGSGIRLDLLAEAAESRWPDRLSLQLRRGDLALEVRTQLVGKQWIPAVLAACLAAEALGIPLAEAAATAGASPPHPGRMQPISLSAGVTVLRDDYNGVTESWDAAFAVMAEARAHRKILVAGDFSDSRFGPRQRLQRMAQSAARWADLAVFIGPDSHYGQKGALEAGMDPAAVAHFPGCEGAADWLRQRLREGDLVLLKGRIREHLARVLFHLQGPVKCTLLQCRHRYLCDQCWRLGSPIRLG